MKKLVGKKRIICRSNGVGQKNAPHWRMLHRNHCVWNCRIWHIFWLNSLRFSVKYTLKSRGIEWMVGLAMLVLALEASAQRNSGTPPSITANPATADFNFPLNPATGQYQATTQQTFALTIRGSNPDPTISLQNISGFAATDATLTSASGQNIDLGGRATVTAGTYNLTISVPDPGQTRGNASVTVQLDSGRLGQASADVSGRIGRDLPGAAPTPTPTTPAPPTPTPTNPTTPSPTNAPPTTPTPPTPTTPTTPTPPPTTPPPPPPTGGGPVQPPIKVLPTPWSGGTTRMSSKDNHHILLNGKSVGQVRVTRGPQAERVVYDWNGAVNARLLLRKNRQLTMSFSPIVSNVVIRGTQLAAFTSEADDAPPGVVVVGLSRPTKSQYRAYTGGFVPRAVQSFTSGRVQR